MAALAVAVLLASCGQAAREDDDSHKGGDRTGLASALGPGLGQLDDGAFGLGRAQRMPSVQSAEPAPSGDVLRVDYPAGSVSPSASREHGAPEGGTQAFLPLDGGPVDEAYLRYWVRFPSDFEFVKGGKLPGLFGGTEVSGGEEPDGTNGFSTRLMWRAHGAGEVYLYAPKEPGESLGRGDWTWPTGRWTCVEQHVLLNDPNSSDGSVTVWLDGRQVHSTDGLLYRTVDDLKIEGVFFSTFFGGADPSWAPAKDQHADFADFDVSSHRLACN